MARVGRHAIVALALVTATFGASAEERSVTLIVDRMACPICAHTVKRSLERVSGVIKATVNLRDKTAVVVYDDAKADVADLINASARAGFPAAKK